MRSWVRCAPWLLSSLAMVLLLGSLTPKRGETLPLYAARNGLLCQSCHFDPNGGGPRNEFGFAFARNRHRLTPEDSTSHWANLAVVNKVGDNMPLFFGVNQRFMLFADNHTGGPDLERLGYFNMETELHVTFQPHDLLTLVYTVDGFAQGPSNIVRSKEAFGMIGGQGAPGYIKVGRFRNPFGLRMDDHTVATRGLLSELGATGSFLPYDPRYPDMGVELGGDVNGFYARMAMTDGSSTPLGAASNANASTVSAKIGHNISWWQSGLSLYSESASGGRRFERWGYYGLTHYGPLAALGEVAAGTDTDPNVIGKINSLAYWAELDYAPTRWSNVRVRYNRQELDRGHGDAIKDASTAQRYDLEGDLVPVPFAELRASVRLIDWKDPTIATERQAFLQFHFSY
jgi:hypothetical protein